VSSTSIRRFRFSGHETFACRYAWLPKAAQAVRAYEDILTAAREDDAMVKLGVGKNMVRSIRFWAETTGTIEATEAGHRPTEFGNDLLLMDGAFDPYLEDIQTLWLLHWKLASNQNALIFSWDYLLNRFHESEISASRVLPAFIKAATAADKKVTTGSLEQLYDVFVHSYYPARGKRGEVREDNLDCPLVELEFLQPAGFTRSSENSERAEPKYVFRREEKSEIGAALFAYCLNDYWMNWHGTELAVPLHMILVGHGSPGQIFKIPEQDIRSRLLGIEEVTSGYFAFEESAAIPRVIRRAERRAPQLAAVYCGGRMK